MNNQTPSTTIATANMGSWSGSLIDPIENLGSRKIYMQIGTSDTTVGPNPMYQLRDQLAKFNDPSLVSFVMTDRAVHTFPTDFDADGNNPCDVEGQPPFVSNCGYDGAGEALQWMYGSLVPRNEGLLTGSVISFDQTGALVAPGMDATGYLYVPLACQDGSTACKLHVALHGCRQSYGQINSAFIKNTGYNKWAGTQDCPFAMRRNYFH
jgi:hypothetical protein